MLLDWPPRDEPGERLDLTVSLKYFAQFSQKRKVKILVLYIEHSSS